MDADYNNQFINGQNSLSGQSQLQTALADLDLGSGGGGSVNPLQENIDFVGVFKGVNCIDPINNQDLATKQYVDNKVSSGDKITSLLNPSSFLQAQQFKIQNGNMPLDMGNQVITNVLQGSALSDVCNRQYTDGQLATKTTQAQNDLRYYQNTVRLDQITLPQADLNMNTTNKIINLADGSNSQDAYTYGQAQTALNLKQDKSASLQQIQTTAPLTSNLDISTNSAYKTLIATADDSLSIKQAINKEYFDSHQSPLEHLYIRSTTIPTVSTQATGFSVVTQQTSPNSNIVFSANNITLKGGITYQINMRVSTVQSANNNTLTIQLVSGSNVPIYGDDSSYIATTGLSNTQQDNRSASFLYKPTINTTIFCYALTVTAITSCVISVSIVQLATTSSIIQTILPSTAQESLQLLSNNTNPTVNTPLTDTFWNAGNSLTNLSTITYSNGLITLPPNKWYEITLDSQFTNSSVSAIQAFELYNNTTGQPLFGNSSQLSRIITSASGAVQANSATSCLVRVYKPTVSTIISVRCTVSSGSLAGQFTSLTLRNLTEFSAASNTTSNLVVNSNIDMSTYFLRTNSNPVGATDVVNLNYLQGYAQKAIPTSNYNMQGFKIQNLAPATLAGDAVRFDQLSAGFVTNPLSGALDCNSFGLNNISFTDSPNNVPNIGFLRTYGNNTVSKEIYDPLSVGGIQKTAKYVSGNFQITNSLGFLYPTAIIGADVKFNPSGRFQVLDQSQSGIPIFDLDNQNYTSRLNLPLVIGDNSTTTTYPTSVTISASELNSSNAPGLFVKGATSHANGSLVNIQGKVLINGVNDGTADLRVTRQVEAQGFTVVAPCSINWKKDIVPTTNELQWIDNLQFYSFSYDDNKLIEYGINPELLVEKHIRNVGLMMEDVDSSYIIQSEIGSSWSGNPLLNRSAIDQACIVRHHQRIAEQQIIINQLLARVTALENAQLNQKMNLFTIDQLSDEDQPEKVEEPVKFDKKDVPDVSKSIFKSFGF